MYFLHTHLQTWAEALLEDIQMSGIKHKLQRLLPVTQGTCGAEGVHKEAADLDPKSIPTRPKDSSPLLMWGSSSTRAAL